MRNELEALLWGAIRPESEWILELDIEAKTAPNRAERRNPDKPAKGATIRTKLTGKGRLRLQKP